MGLLPPIAAHATNRIRRVARADDCHTSCPVNGSVQGSNDRLNPPIVTGHTGPINPINYSVRDPWPPHVMTQATASAGAPFPPSGGLRSR